MAEYKTEYHNGGLLRYMGAQAGGKAIRSVVKDSAECSVTVTFTDGCVYKIKADRSESGDRVTLTNITETWTNADGTTNLIRR